MVCQLRADLQGTDKSRNFPITGSNNLGWDRYFRIFAHRARKISSLSTCDSAHKSVAKALRTLVFSARPTDVVSCVTTNCANIRSCEVFGLKCVKLEEFKVGYSVDLLFSSPETLEKLYECQI